MKEPKEMTVNGKQFILTKFPPVAGREIVMMYPSSALPKFGSYKVNQEIMLKLMSYVFVPMPSGDPLPLSSQALVDNHVSDWEMLTALEKAMLEYNCTFFQNGLISKFLDDLAQKVPEWVTKTLMDLSRQSSPMEKPPSTN